MSVSHSAPAIPHSLEAMIAEAKGVIETWPEDERRKFGAKDDVVEAADDWILRLSRGDFDDHLYWNCVAEDCEGSGDWDGAKAAYTKVLEIEEAKLWWWQAHGAIAMLCKLLGDQEQALRHYRKASEVEGLNTSPIFYRSCLASLAWQELRLGRPRAARSTLKRAWKTFEPEFTDGLNFSRLRIVEAAYFLKRFSPASAEQSLAVAKEVLEARCKQMDNASGLLSVYSAWWQIEADRRHILGEHGIIEALQNCLDYAERAAVGWNRLKFDVHVMQAFESLSEAYRRAGREAEAAEARSNANAIRTRWHLPPIAREPTGRRRLLNRAWSKLTKLLRHHG